MFIYLKCLQLACPLTRGHCGSYNPDAISENDALDNLPSAGERSQGVCEIKLWDLTFLFSFYVVNVLFVHHPEPCCEGDECFLDINTR